MAEILATGYQSIRDAVQAAWDYFEIRDNVGTPIIRIPVSDPRCTWTHVPGAQTLELTCVVKGSDADLSGVLPKTIAGSAFFTDASGGTALSAETFTAFTMATADDQLTVKHQVQIPQVV